MKRRLPLVLIALMALLCLMAGRPWVLFGEKAPMHTQERYATGRDETFDPADPRQHEEGRWTFTAENISAQHDSRYIEAEGNATFTDGTNTLRADFARYYEQSGWVLLKGNVRAMWQGDFLEAEEGEFNLAGDEGWLKNGKVFVVKPHLYFESEYIRKNKGSSYSFKQAKVTRCSGKNPAWSFNAKEGDIVLDEYAKLWHTTFQVQGIPVAYLPYVKVPASKGRQSGFLLPEIASSTRFGMSVNMPYYWAVDEETDVTFYQNMLTDRGYRQGLELRHSPDAYTKGYWRFDWLHDSKTVARASDEDDLTEDDMLRPNHNRWWLRGKYNGYVGVPSWRAMVDVDVVSDQDYLKEFKSGMLGYTESEQEMLEEFGRAIDPLDSETRTSSAMVTRDFEDYGVAAKLEYTQNLRFMNGNDDADKNPTVQRLPELDAFAFKDSVAGTPLEFEGQAKYDYFYREYGTKGHRLDLRPKLSLPMRSEWITAIPSVGLQADFYSVDRWETDGNQTLANGQSEGNHTAENDNPMSLAVEAGLSLFSEVYKVFTLDTTPLTLAEENVGTSRWMDIKHSMVPRIDYSYQPKRTGQTDLPYFDRRDRVFGKNEVTFSLTNVLDRRRETVTLATDGSPVLTTDYLDFARLRLSQSYDYFEASRQDELDTYERRPFSDIMAEVIVKPAGGLELVSRTWYSPYLSAVTEHEHMLRYKRDQVGDFFVGYDSLSKIDEYKRQRGEEISMLHLGGNLYIAQNVILGLEFRRDLASGENLERTVRLLWEGECYNVGFELSNSDTDTRFGLTFDIFDF